MVVYKFFKDEKMVIENKGLKINWFDQFLSLWTQSHTWSFV